MPGERMLVAAATSVLVASGCGEPRPSNAPEAPTGSARESASAAPAAAARPLDLAGFVYPGSAEFTWGHVTANVGEITWHARVTSDPPEKVVAWFEERFGPGQRTENGEVVWRDDPEHTKDVGSVMPIDAPGPHHDGTKIPEGARTVILTSSMTRY
ncbi:MAG: hypothetical protein U0414_16855 [Polyangiaceae bacterium]